MCDYFNYQVSMQQNKITMRPSASVLGILMQISDYKIHIHVFTKRREMYLKTKLPQYRFRLQCAFVISVP